MAVDDVAMTLGLVYAQHVYPRGILEVEMGDAVLVAQFLEQRCRPFEQGFAIPGAQRGLQLFVAQDDFQCRPQLFAAPSQGALVIGFCRLQIAHEAMAGIGFFMLVQGVVECAEQNCQHQGEREKDARLQADILNHRRRRIKLKVIEAKVRLRIFLNIVTEAKSHFHEMVYRSTAPAPALLLSGSFVYSPRRCQMVEIRPA